MVKSTRQSASSLFGLVGLAAYFVDEVVVFWGTRFDADLDKAVQEAKDERGRERTARRIVQRWIPSQRRR